ncbi:MAG: hypothetical protein A2445_04490 [Candidatus Jacksonbacteria bacterium RIFOXYC2_FULL_44_29]|nr:MAG: hypothetical protein UV19_C0003G0021 [Parcubacteria group bacterium GW2011_GWA2_42_28]KKT55840.1 MAG: hypothetical protein UW45_C0004G0021 [Parcubacteria group bacterium GW2011_GWC2_44_22]OGY75618.1 MAG: hypothetical protein A2240_03680 [Candidatus Jacksonbacteria bacterium RIFOXYA2_FULL_43_12]OGY76591.1 MAG: hypothetical protein A2295_01420 [Candidatus Jacksonbacteria bacterium RIFOXYB2_FULL_44_15]OGY78316.1 MAG: hypothetical protein A2445_04490 [Candidatus Jacksonbacteria bacterium RI
MQTKFKAAIVINAIEPVFFTAKHLFQCSILVQEQTPLAEFAVANFSCQKLIYFKAQAACEEPLTFAEILAKTNLGEQLVAQQIKYLVVPHRSSIFIEQWAKKRGIELMVTPWSTQKRLEDKIYFDNLLKKYRLASPPTVNLAGRDLEKVNHKSYVVQKSGSYGLFGTKFMSASDLSAFRKKHLRQVSSYLVREYLPGVPIGVTIFLDKAGNYFYAGLRRQCFLNKNGFPSIFSGIQWLPANFFGSKTLSSISTQLEHLTKLLQKENFYGVANVDILISQEKALVLECNPRLSSATPHIFAGLSLATNPNPWQFFLDTFWDKQQLTISDRRLPVSDFTGSLLDIDLAATGSLKQILPVGVYSFKNGRVKFVGQRMKIFFNHPDYFLLFHELRQISALKRGATLCTILSNFPVFDLESGELNQAGKEIWSYFREMFLANKNNNKLNL